MVFGLIHLMSIPNNLSLQFSEALWRLSQYKLVRQEVNFFPKLRSLPYASGIASVIPDTPSISLMVLPHPIVYPQCYFTPPHRTFVISYKVPQQITAARTFCRHYSNNIRIFWHIPNVYHVFPHMRNVFFAKRPRSNSTFSQVASIHQASPTFPSPQPVCHPTAPNLTYAYPEQPPYSPNVAYDSPNIPVTIFHVPSTQSTGYHA